MSFLPLLYIDRKTSMLTQGSFDCCGLKSHFVIRRYLCYLCSKMRKSLHCNLILSFRHKAISVEKHSFRILKLYWIHSFLFRFFFLFFFILILYLVSGRVTRPSYTPHQVKTKQLIHSQTKRSLAFRPATTDLTRSSSMGFLNQVL